MSEAIYRAAEKHSKESDAGIEQVLDFFAGTYTSDFMTDGECERIAKHDGFQELCRFVEMIRRRFPDY